MKFKFKEIKLKPNILIIDFGNLYYFSKPQYLVPELLKGKLVVTEQFFINLNSYVRNFNPTSVIIADDNFSNWRRNIYPDYKLKREEDWKEQEVTDIMNIYHLNKRKIREILKSNIFPVYYFRVDELEADDICYLSAKRLEKYECIIMSSDKDFIQISQKFKNVRIYNPTKKQFYDDPGYDILRYKCLAGDNSDGIKGIPKIGEKTALKILSTKSQFNRWYLELNTETKQLYKDTKSIIDFESIPIDLQNNFYSDFDSYNFKKYEENKIKNLIKENNFDRINIINIRNNFETLKQLPI
jgi:DNA polymerase-1